MFEPIWNRNYVSCVQITMAEDFGVEDRGHFYDPVGALRDVVVNHLMQVVAAAAMEPPAARRRRDAQGRDVLASSGRCPTPTRRTTCAGSTRATGRSTGCAEDSTTETYAALRLEIDNWRWSGVPFFIRTGQATCRHPDRAAARLPTTRRACGFRARGPAGPSRTSSWSSSTRRPASGCSSTPSAPTRRSPSRSTSTWSSREEGGEGADALRGAAARGDERRQHALHPAGQRRGDLADPAAAARLARRPCTSTRRDRGGPRRRTSSCPATAAGTARGWRHERGKPRAKQGRRERRGPSRPDRAPRAPPRRRRSRRSPTTRSCRTATRARWSRPTARSTGCAFRASTRRACSARCSTARPAPSGSGRSASTIPQRARLRARDEHPADDLEDADRLDHGPRRADDGPATRRGRDHAAHPAAGRRRRRPHAGAHGPVPRRPASRSSWSASRSSTTAARRPSGRWSTTDRHTADASGAGQTIRLQTDMAVGIEGDRVRARHVLEQGEQIYCALSWAEDLDGAAGRRRGQRAARRHDDASGAPGSGGPASPTTAGAIRSSARR